MSQPLFPGQMKTALGSQATLQILFNTCFLVHLKFSVPQTLIWCQALGWVPSWGPQGKISVALRRQELRPGQGGAMAQQRTPLHVPGDITFLNWLNSAGFPPGSSVWNGAPCLLAPPSSSSEAGNAAKREPHSGSSYTLAWPHSSCPAWTNPSQGSALHLLPGISLWELRFPELSGWKRTAFFLLRLGGGGWLSARTWVVRTQKTSARWEADSRTKRHGSVPRLNAHAGGWWEKRCPGRR